MGESLEKRLKKWMLLAKMKEAAENNLQKRLSIGSLFFYLKLLSCFYSCICKIRKLPSIL
jgi:hypothetical protein